MKAIRITLFLVSLFILRSEVFAQRVVVREGRRHRRPAPVVVIKRSPFRPAKVTIYHPYWRPDYTYHRRWIFFPRYNIYWDNWRNQYVFRNGSVWVSQTAAPPAVVHVNLSNERTIELNENQDDVDDIYQSNDQHIKENNAN